MDKWDQELPSASAKKLSAKIAALKQRNNALNHSPDKQPVVPRGCEAVTVAGDRSSFATGLLSWLQCRHSWWQLPQQQNGRRRHSSAIKAEWVTAKEIVKKYNIKRNKMHNTPALMLHSCYDPQHSCYDPATLMLCYDPDLQHASLQRQRLVSRWNSSTKDDLCTQREYISIRSLT